MIYFIVLLFILFPVIKYDICKAGEGKEKWYYFNLILFILLAGCRYRVGGDTLIYMQLFQDYPTLSELKDFDFESATYNPLWYIYNAIIKSICDSFILFQFVQAIIVNSIFFYFFKKYTIYYFSAILVYYFAYYLYFNFEILREILCVCLFMLSFSYLKERKLFKYYLFCIIALFIHFSSVIMLFIPLVMLFRKESFMFIVSLSLLLFIFLTFIDIIPFLLSLVLEGNMLTLAEHYFESEVSLMGMVYQFISLLPILVFMYVRNKNQIKTDEMIGKLMMGCILIYITSMFIEGIWRLVNYFTPFIILYVVNTFYLLIKYRFIRQVSTVCMFFSLSFFSFTWVYYYIQDRSEYFPHAKFYHIFYPYHSIFNPKIDVFREEFLENYRDMTIKI